MNSGSAAPIDRVLSLTWTIPQDFGGMTSVLLHRAAALHEIAGIPVDVLTLAGGFDLEAETASLRASGKLADGVRLRNLWAEVGQVDDAELDRWAALGQKARAGLPQIPESGGLAERDFRDEASGLSGTVHYRGDGSIAAVDQKKKNGKPRRLITLVDREGRPQGAWAGAWAFYFSWLDHLRGDHPAWIISDSKYVGGYLHAYRRDRATVVQVLHNAHLAAGTEPEQGQLSKGYREVVQHLDGFDRVAILTQQQCDELQASEYVGEHGVVVHNSRTLPAPRDTARDPAAGVIVARMTGQKRLDHAIEAFSIASGSRSELTLDIIGDGPDRTSLESQVQKLGMGERVSFLGYRSDAPSEFARGGYTVMSSVFEGMGLTIVEAMAEGCLPIAYDIRYGPSDIITDGVDGFLVPAGDVEALGNAIVRATSLDDDTAETMRIAARRRAQDFSDTAVTQRWIEVLSGPGSPIREAPEISARLSGMSLHDGQLTIKGSLHGADLRDAAVRVALVEEGGSGYLRARAEVTRRLGRQRFTADIPFEAVGSWDATRIAVRVDADGGTWNTQSLLQTSDRARSVGGGQLTTSSDARGRLLIIIRSA